jgi:hypothetical protein
VIRDEESGAGQPLMVNQQPSSSSSAAASTTSSGSTAMTSYANVLTDETQLCGKKIKNSYILMFLFLSLLVGLKGLILALLILGIGYYVIGAPASSANGSSSSGGGGGGRPRSNVRGLSDYPKPPPKSC